MSLLEYFKERLDYFKKIYSDYFDKFEFTNILVRYAEIGTKSNKVRERMERSLIDDVKIILNRRDIDFTRYYVEPGRIYFSFKREDVKIGSFILLNIPGIKSISPVLKTNLKIENITKKCAEYAKNYGFKSTMSLGIKVKIIQRYRFQDEDPKSISEKCAAAIFEELEVKDGQVNIASPDLKINVEIRENFTYIYSRKIYAFHQGLPVEFERASIANYLGRFYDIDAMIRIMRRGQHILPIFFETYKNKNLDYILEIFSSFKNFYPIENFYVIKIDLEWILNILRQSFSKSKKTQDNLSYLCPYCRYLRYLIIDYIIKHRLSIFTPLTIKGNSNIAKISKRRSSKRRSSKGRSSKRRSSKSSKYSEKTHSKKDNSFQKVWIRKFQGIIDGEKDDSENFYCPFIEKLWNTTAAINQPYFYPEFIIEPCEIKQNLIDLLISNYFLNLLHISNIKSKNNRNNKNNNINNNATSRIAKNYIEKLEMDQKKIEDIRDIMLDDFNIPICGFKQEIKDFNLEHFEDLKNSVGIKNLIKKSVENIQIINLF